MSASHVTEFYIISLLLILLLGFTVWRSHRGGPGWLGAGRWLAPAGGAVLAVIGLLVIFNLNVSLVRADIIYKQGQAYDNARRYTEAIQLYQMAIDEEPQEDYYYLFLGRAQLEQGRASTGAQQTGFLANAEESLLRAQALNPLNTDHSANLGRLYLTWSQLTSGQQRADARAEIAGLLPGSHRAQPQRGPSAQRVRHRLSGGRRARQGAGAVRDLAGAGPAIRRHLSAPG